MQSVVRHLDLFSGIGGFALACRMVGGIETVAFCEREPYCQKVLAKHWPRVPICPDIHDLKGTEYGTVELITGGYPCQPFSLAGKRQGAADDRHLWPELRRVVEAARPSWVLCENVVGHVTLGLDEVLSDLDSIGYSCLSLVIPACAVDASHRRPRIWILAHSNDYTNRANGLAQIEKGSVSKVDWKAGRSRLLGGTGADSEVLADSNGAGVEGSKIAGSVKGGRAKLHKQPCGCREVFCSWEPEPDVGRVAHGIPNRVDRLRGLGNAIVPQVAAEIIRAMMQADRMANPSRQPPAAERTV